MKDARPQPQTLNEIWTPPEVRRPDSAIHTTAGQNYMRSVAWGEFGKMAERLRQHNYANVDAVIH